MNESSKLSTGAIIGISVGGVVFLLLCAATVCYLFRQSKHDDNRVVELQRNHASNQKMDDSNYSQEIDHVNNTSFNNYLPSDDLDQGK